MRHLNMVTMGKDLRALSDKREVVARPQSRGRVSFRVLLWIMFFASFGVLFVQEMNLRFGALAAATAVLAILSVLAHLAGAAIGSRYRDPVVPLQRPSSSNPADDLAETDGSDLPEVVHMQPMHARKNDFAPATELSRQEPLKRTPIYWAVGVGSTVSAVVASVILTLVMWDNLAIVNVVFGAISAAVIGGLFGFWLSSFFQVVRSAVSDAQKKT